MFRRIESGSSLSSNFCIVEKKIPFASRPPIIPEDEPDFRLARVSDAKIPATSELPVQLAVQIVTVCQHDNRRRRHRLLQLLGEKDHRQ